MFRLIAVYILYTQMNTSRLSVTTNFVSQLNVQDAKLEKMVRLDVELYVVLARNVVTESKENLWVWVRDVCFP